MTCLYYAVILNYLDGTISFVLYITWSYVTQLLKNMQVLMS